MSRLIALALAALGMPALALSCAHAGDDSVATERGEGSGEAAGEYWTPERLREAQPLPMPHPTTPPGEAGDREAPPAGDRSSVSEDGSPGSGDVEPDQSNYLFPSDLLANDEAR